MIVSDIQFCLAILQCLELLIQRKEASVFAYSQADCTSIYLIFPVENYTKNKQESQKGPRKIS